MGMFWMDHLCLSHYGLLGLWVVGLALGRVRRMRRVLGIVISSKCLPIASWLDWHKKSYLEIYECLKKI